MKIKIRFIGRYKDITKKHESTIEITKGNTIWDIIDLLGKQYPEIEKDKKFIMVSKNNTFTTINATIDEGDEISIFPPVVAGG